MSAARAFILALICLAFASFAAFADVAVPPLTGRIVDQTATLSPEASARIDQKLRAFETRKGSQIAILILPTTQPETIEQYSIRVAEQWKLGRNKIDDGVILVVAKNDRKLRIEVGYGLEGALTDVTARRIIDEVITPKFKNSDFSGGIEDGIDRIIGVIDGEPLPAPAPQHDWLSAQNFDPGIIFNPFIIVGALVIGGLMRTMLGRLWGALATGGLVAVIAWFLIASLIGSAVVGIIAFVFTLFGDSVTPSSGRGGRGSGWSGSSGGSWSSGSSGSSSDSGFSGGGGSFGGGGASGSW
jgi:uncharacterized protein